MTPDEQYIALLEWQGWTRDERAGYWLNHKLQLLVSEAQLPPLTLDLCAEWENKLCDVPGIYDAAHLRYKYAANLYRIVPPERQPIRATKEQRMEALCRTLWPERFKEQL